MSGTYLGTEHVSALMEHQRRAANPVIADMECLAKEIIDFEKGLDPSQEIALSLASGAGGTLLHVEHIYRRAPRMIIFEGRDQDGRSVRLVQHHSQVSLLLVAAKKLGAEATRIKIGFDTSGPKQAP